MIVIKKVTTPKELKEFVETYGLPRGYELSR